VPPQAPWGEATVVAGMPNKVTRDSVIGNTAGTTDKLDFTSTVTVYCDIPAKRRMLLDKGVAGPALVSAFIKGLLPAADAPVARVTLGVVPLGLVLLSSQSVSNAAAIDFTSGIDDTYDEYLLECLDVVPATDSVGAWLRVPEDAGVTWESGASDYAHTRYANAGATTAPAGNGADPNTKLELAPALGNGAGETFSASIHIIRPSGSRYKLFMCDAVQWSAPPAITRISVGGIYKGCANAINGVRFHLSSGNIASGLFKLYGLRK